MESNLQPHKNSFSTIHKVIAIDGPAGAGKSTVAKQLAKELNYSYLDTGAMYRSLTLKAMNEGLNLEDEHALVVLAKRTNIDLEDKPDGLKVYLDGRDVSQEIRTVEVTNNTFYIARTPGVRAIMVEWQRKIASKRNVVAEGRDIGTVVFPQATYKFFFDAQLEERSHRRLKELAEKGKDVDARQLTKELQERDEKDTTRSVGALKKAEDAVYIDTTGMTVMDVVQKVLEIIKHG
jgi:cytidylate kinase